MEVGAVTGAAENNLTDLGTEDTIECFLAVNK